MNRANPNRLVVEDEDLRGVVIGLMKRHLDEWGATEDKWPVHVLRKNGKSTVLSELSVEFKASGLKRLGIVIDADDDLQGTWDQVANFCRSAGGKPPIQCPKE